MYLKSLNEKYAYGVMLRLAENPKGVMFSELSGVVKNPYSREKLLKILEEDGLIRMIERTDRGRKQYLIALTRKGMRVAELLKKADMIGVKRSGVDPCHAGFISKVKALEEAVSGERYVSFDCEGEVITITGKELLDLARSWAIYRTMGIYERKTYEITNGEEILWVGVRSTIIDLLGHAKDGWTAHLGIMAEAVRRQMAGQIKAGAVSKMLQRGMEIIGEYEKILGEMLTCKGFKAIPAIIDELRTEYFESGLMLLSELPDSEMCRTTVESWASGACAKWNNREKRPWTTLLKNAETVLMAFSEIPLKESVDMDKLHRAESMLKEVAMKVVPPEEYGAIAMVRREIERMFWLGEDEIEGDEELFFVKLPEEDHVSITKSAIKDLALVLNFAVVLKVREEVGGAITGMPDYYMALIEKMEKYEATLREALKILKGKGVAGNLLRFIKREIELRDSLEDTWKLEADDFEADLVLNTLIRHIITVRDIWADEMEMVEMDNADVEDVYYVEITRVAELIDEWRKHIREAGAKLREGILEPKPLTEEERKKYRAWVKKWHRETKKWHRAVEEFRDVLLRHYYEEENEALKELEQPPIKDE